VRRRIGCSADDLISRMLTPPEAAAPQFLKVSPSSRPCGQCLTLVMHPLEVQDTAPGDRDEFR
jgi:hypothetical protein